MADAFRFGIEEEYFLADAASGRSPDGATADRFHEAARRFVKPASHELLKGQVEVQTEPGTRFDEACEALRGMRRELAGIAQDHGLLLLAAGTHPLARVREQETTEKERYKRLESEFGIIAQRAMICAMHIHVEAPEPDRRIELMNRLIPFIPLLLALSVSSPFWQGRDTGIRAFRLTAFAQWPRMGVPEIFSGQEEYQRYIDLLVGAGIVEDASFVWWHIRPSTHYPTIELRVCDSCPRVEDAVAIAALYQALMRCVARRPELNAAVGPVERGICAQNIWLAQQHGVEAKLIDPEGRARPVAEQLDALIEMTREDAEALGSTSWIGRLPEIARRGAAADRQLARYEAALAAGEGPEGALRRVVRAIAEETVS